MNCPYCKDEMELGVIQSSQEINWQEKRYLFNRSDLYDKSICLAPRSFWKGSAVEAWLCRRCKKVVIDFESETSVDDKG